MNLQQIGWNNFFADQCADSPFLPGRVALVRRGFFTLWTEAGELALPASARLRRVGDDWPCIGDWVLIRETSSIVSVLARRTKLSRKQPGSQLGEQILAANMDVLFIVSGLDLDYNPRRLDTEAAVARGMGAAFGNGEVTLTLNQRSGRGERDSPFVTHVPARPRFVLVNRTRTSASSAGRGRNRLMAEIARRRPTSRQLQSLRAYILGGSTAAAAHELENRRVDRTTTPVGAVPPHRLPECGSGSLLAGRAEPHRSDSQR